MTIDQITLFLKSLYRDFFGQNFTDLTFPNLFWFIMSYAFIIFIKYIWIIMYALHLAIKRIRKRDVYEYFYGDWNYYRTNGQGEINEITIRISPSFFQKNPTVNFDSDGKLTEKFRAGKLIMSDSAIYFVFGSSDRKIADSERTEYPFLIAIKKFIKPQRASVGFALGQSIGNGKTYSAKIFLSKDKIDRNLLKDQLPRSSDFDDSAFKRLGQFNTEKKWPA